MPLLCTERLCLRSFEARDRDSLFEIVSDPQTCHDDGGYAPYAAQDARFEALLARYRSEEGRLMIELTAKTKAIGVIHLFEAEEGGHELGYVMHKAYRRQGFAFEALSAFLAHCFAQPHVRRIAAGTFVWNTASMGLLEKLGFERTGIARDALRHNDYGLVSQVTFCKTR